jgi:hypothetical protein
VGPGWCTIRALEGPPRVLLDACERLDVEGVVAKRVDSPYRPGVRSRDWLKLKTVDWKRSHAPPRLTRVVECLAGNDDGDWCGTRSIRADFLCFGEIAGSLTAVPSFGTTDSGVGSPRKDGPAPTESTGGRAHGHPPAWARLCLLAARVTTRRSLGAAGRESA